MINWYVVHTHVRAEAKVVLNLKQQGFEAFSPQYIKRRSHARRIDHVSAPMFPRYIFVALDPTLKPWRAVHSTFGACYLVCYGDVPAPMPEGIVENIISRQDENGFVTLSSADVFKKGQSVKIVNGAFSGQFGLFDCATDDERIIVLLDMLGRRVKVRLAIGSVAATA